MHGNKLLLISLLYMQIRTMAVLAWSYERTKSTYNPCHIQIPIRYKNCFTAVLETNQKPGFRESSGFELCNTTYGLELDFALRAVCFVAFCLTILNQLLHHPFISNLCPE